MKKTALLLLNLFMCLNTHAKTQSTANSTSTAESSISAVGQSSIYDLKVKDIDGKNVEMSKYKNKVLLIVNSASQCGYTPQFSDLENLQKKYGAQGFQVLAFPSNDFKQDVGPNVDSKKIATDNYKVSFPLFDKQSVTGDKKQPVFQYLVNNSQAIPKEIQWNFEKFLVDREGHVVDRFRSSVSPSDKVVTSVIEKLLKK